MHHCLLDPHIYHNILQFARLHFPVQDADPFQGFHQYCDINPTLLSLAVTCKAFLEPTLNILWCSQISLAPIVRTLPDGVLMKSILDWDPSGEPRYILTPLRPPLASEWTRFDYYARRIQKLGFYPVEFPENEVTNMEAPNRPQGHRYSVHPRVVLHLCISRGQRVLLPNLTHLRWNFRDADCTELLPMFFGPKLTFLAISFGTPPQTKGADIVKRTLNSIVDCCPSITDLEIPSSHPDPVVEAAIEWAFHCRRLEGFYLNTAGGMPIPLLHRLAEEPSLRRLRLSMDEEVAEQDMKLMRECIRPPFPALQKLWIVFDQSLAPCSELIRIMGSCALHTLEIIVHFSVPPAELEELFAALQDHCAPHTLQVLEIMTPLDEKFVRENEGTPEGQFHLGNLDPVLLFPNIRRFRLELQIFFEFDNNDIMTIADCWPLLTDLRLASYGFFLPTEITWAGFAYHVYKCPQLELLCLAWNATTEDVALVTSLPDFRPNRALRFLWASDSILGESPEHYAECLFAVAPLVHSVSGHVHEDTRRDMIAQVNPVSFYTQVETVLWQLRRTHMREEFGFLDEYKWMTLAFTRGNLLGDRKTYPSRSRPRDALSGDFL
ncbi:hypothetical protein C8Q80DRAFT_519088 [Daedaleopsis nitida]|nr:hypothetical protein C8Q80DRAFT_519088 [Daedaleopsis nitida]